MVYIQSHILYIWYIYTHIHTWIFFEKGHEAYVLCSWGPPSIDFGHPMLPKQTWVGISVPVGSYHTFFEIDVKEHSLSGHNM